MLVQKRTVAQLLDRSPNRDVPKRQSLYNSTVGRPTSIKCPGRVEFGLARFICVNFLFRVCCMLFARFVAAISCSNPQHADHPCGGRSGMANPELR
jgi:hypothetical protein